MNSETSAVANSGLMLVLCAIPVIIIAFQAILFLMRAWKEADRLGISVETRKKVVANSAVFSIIPSLPIIIIMAILLPALGKYLPWLRLSVIGSAMYENMAADMTVKAFGLAGVSDSGMSPAIFTSIAWVMTLGVIMYPLANIFILKKYDSGIKKGVRKGGFIQYAIPAMFVGVMAVFTTPYLVHFANPTGITTVLVAAIMIFLLDWLSKKFSIGWLKEFSFPLSMLVGMGSAIPFSGIFS